MFQTQTVNTPDWLKYRPAHRPDLAERIEYWEQLALVPVRKRSITPFMLTDLDVEAWDHIGDPLAENFVFAVYEAGLKDTDVIDALHQLLKLENQAAIDFYAAVTHVPDYLNFERMLPFERFVKRNIFSQLGTIYAGFPVSYSDEKIARVLSGSGRLRAENDYGQRIWETLAGLATTRSVEAMKPGGSGWEQWVRIRIMHTKVRIGVKRSGKWDYENAVSPGGPISAVGTAGGVYLFGEFNAQVAEGLGGSVSQFEFAASIRMWQWVAIILGSPPELIGATLEEQRYLNRLLGLKILRPGPAARELTQSLYDGMKTVPVVKFLPRKLYESLGRRAMDGAVKRGPLGQEGINFSDDMGISWSPMARLPIELYIAFNRLWTFAHKIPVLKTVLYFGVGKALDAILEYGQKVNKPTFTTPYE